MRSVTIKTIVVGFTALAVSLAAAGCSASKNHSESGSEVDEGTGTVGMKIQAAPGVIINTVSYTITGNGFSKTGTVDTSASTPIQFQVGGIPSGTGYNIALTANSVAGGLTFTGGATFNIVAKATTTVSVHLKGVGSNNKGSVMVNGTLNVCPLVDTVSAAPTTVEVGTPVLLAAAASDLDNAPSAITYAWTATSGTIAAPASASTAFNCTTTGTSTITLTASDGDCTDTSSIVVTCTGTSLPPPDAGPPPPPPPPPPAITTDSLLTAKAASCQQCAVDNGCLAPTTSCEGITGAATAGPATGTSKSTLCLDTLSCVLTTNCAASGSGTGCYCGTASGAACLGAGAANGACKTQEEAGLETTDPSTVATGFGDTTKGGGVANILVQCLNDSACTSCF